VRSATDRRPQSRGDERRAALLRALDEHLQDSSLDSITIAEISRRAGVTRSAFYFYFESKATAVAALVERMYDDAVTAAAHLTADGSPQANIEATIRGLFEAWERHQHVFVAMLDARAGSAAVRELWESDRESFVPVVAAMVDAERAAGRAPAGPPSAVLAATLLELNDRMLERLARGTDLPRDDHVAVVVHVWLSSIYGRTP
jgi:AcrR family transcriptional regulator